MFSDTEFTDWLYAFDATGNVSGSAQTVSSGGNPGAYREVEHSFSQDNVSIQSYNLYDASYNPASQGELSELVFSVDAQLLATNDPTGQVGFGFLIAQGGQYFWLAVPNLVQNQGWQPRALTLRPDSAYAYSAGPATAPDFAGGPMRFGVILSNSASGIASFYTRSGLDNFGVALVTPAYDRVRASFSEDAGSILQARTLIPVESAISEAFLYGVALPAGNLYSYRRLLTPGTVSARYYPLPTNNDEFLSTYQGETKLGRMAETYPKRLIFQATDVFGTPTMTPQQAITHIFTTWVAEHDWFSFERVPELRPPSASGEGLELSIPAAVIAQLNKERLTMREIVDEWAGIFPGTLLRQNSAGNIVLIPRYGPDAPTAATALSWRDLVSISEGKPDPRGSITRATVRSQGWAFEEATDPLEPAWTARRHYTYSDAEPDNWFDPPNDRLEIALSSFYSANYLGFWPLVDGSLLEEGGAVRLKDDNGAPLIAANWRWLDHYGALHEEVSDIQDVLNQPTTGDWHEAFRLFKGLTYGATLSSFYALIEMRYDETRNGMEVRVKDGKLYASPHATFDGALWSENAYAMFELYLNSGATVFKRANAAVTGSFGYSSGDTVPAKDGGNLLEALPEREASLTSNVFQLTAEQCALVAQGHVLANAEPKTVRRVEQSAWNAFPIDFDDIGTYVDLPNGERALVENVGDTEYYNYQGGSVSSVFSCTITEALIDRISCYLYFDEGTQVLLDSGAFAAPDGCAYATGGGGSVGAPVEGFAMTPDPGFSTSSLPNDNPDATGRTTRDWYLRAQTAWNHAAWDAVFDSDDYRWANRAGAALLGAMSLAYRCTGDLTIVDRAITLINTWAANRVQRGRHGASGSYLSWDNETYTDTAIDAQLVAGTLALAAAMAHSARAESSPAGHTYAAFADTWLDWLENEHLPDWGRISNHPDGPASGQPYIGRAQQHCWRAEAYAYLYLYQRTGEAKYLATFGSMMDYIFDEQITNCDAGLAGRTVALWSHAEYTSTNKNARSLQYVTYGQNEMPYALQFLLDGADARFSQTHFEQWANAYAAFVFDGDPQNTGLPFASSMGGEVSQRCGREIALGYRSRQRSSDGAGALHFAVLTLFDTSGTMESDMQTHYGSADAQYQVMWAAARVFKHFREA